MQKNDNDSPLETSEHEARPYKAGDEKAGQIVDAEWTPLGDLVSRFPEINFSNYGDEEVRALQEWAFEAVDALKVADKLRQALQFVEDSLDRALHNDAITYTETRALRDHAREAAQAALALEGGAA